MPMSPYVLVLARNTHEGATYIRRAGLPRGRWRNVASASSIRGIRQAHVHVLPGFKQRPDRHAITAELRHAKCEWFDVEMPEGLEAPPVDQGDGMGQQLTIDDIPVSNMLEAEDEKPQWQKDLDAVLEPEGWEPPATLDAEQVLRLAAGESGADVAPVEEPKQRRRTRCGQCGELHFKDDACAEDMVAPINKTPAPVVFH